MRGRKPAEKNVVPLTGGGFQPNNHDAIARKTARDLKPRGLSKDASRVWDQIAPLLTHPTVARLKPEHVPLFAELCKVRARLDDLRAPIAAYGSETYESHTRNGLQHKTYPEVGQLNDVVRQFITLCDRFGMNPSAARGLADNGQGFLPLDGNEFF